MKILVCDPAKNITVFVLEPLAADKRPALVRAIMSDERIKAEQAGFVIKPDSGSRTWRLEMADGEFCGNATRCFGLYVAREKGLKGRLKLPVSVSGIKEPVLTEVDTELGWAAAEIPGPLSFDTLDYNGLSLPVLVFEGITHIIAQDLEPEKEHFFAIKALLEAKFSGFVFPAFGVMFYDTGRKFMCPAVYVHSLVFESSCGSGSAALGAWLSQGLWDGTVKYAINQPGGTIDIDITRKSGKIGSIAIGGKVSIGEPEEFLYTHPFP